MGDELAHARRSRRTWIVLAAIAAVIYMTLHIVAMPGEEIALGGAFTMATRAATWHGWLIARSGQAP